jgi:hypothetical protein
MNKTVKFKTHFVKAILAKEKIATTRLFDDKNLSAGDVVDLVDSGSKIKFATAKITKVEKTTFDEMVSDAKDAVGMYQQYRLYYNREIKPEDEVKKIYFDPFQT